MGGFCTPSLDRRRLAVCVGIGELDVRASSVRDGVLRLVPASVGPRSREFGATWCRGCPRHSTSMPPSTRASRSTTSPRWTTGAGRSCDRSHSRASVVRCERIGPPTRRSQRSTRRLESDYARWSRLGDLVLHRFFAFAAAFDDFDSVLAEDDLWVPVPDPDHAGFGAGHAATADRSATCAVSISSSPTPTTSGGWSITAWHGDDGPPTTTCWASSGRCGRSGRSRPHTPRSTSRARFTTSC